MILTPTTRADQGPIDDVRTVPADERSGRSTRERTWRSRRPVRTARHRWGPVLFERLRDHPAGQGTDSGAHRRPEEDAGTGSRTTASGRAVAHFIDGWGRPDPRARERAKFCRMLLDPVLLLCWRRLPFRRLRLGVGLKLQ